MARVVSRRPGGQARSISQPTRFLIVGREGTRELGEYLAQFLFARGNLVDRLLGFDHAHSVSTYRLGINETAPWTFLSHGIDLVIGLDNSSIGFEAQLNMDGTLLLDASMVTVLPSRGDIETVLVPTATLAQDALATAPVRAGLDYQDLVGAVMFGAALSVSLQCPETGELNRLFIKFHRPPVLPLVLATYSGYDWLQDRQMRGKSLTLGVKE